MTQPEQESGKLMVPDEATRREVMKLWRQVVKLDRTRNRPKPPRDSTPPRR
jgi:hypothetical protein